MFRKGPRSRRPRSETAPGEPASRPPASRSAPLLQIGGRLFAHPLQPFRAETGRDLPRVDSFGGSERVMTYSLKRSLFVRSSRSAGSPAMYRSTEPTFQCRSSPFERVRRRTDAEVLRAVPVRRVVAGAEARKGEIRDFVVFESRSGQRVVDREELRFADLLVHGPESPRAARRPKAVSGSTVKWYAEICCTPSERAASSERRSVSPPKPGMPKIRSTVMLPNPARCAARTASAWPRAAVWRRFISSDSRRRTTVRRSKGGRCPLRAARRGTRPSGRRDWLRASSLSAPEQSKSCAAWSSSPLIASGVQSDGVPPPK